MKTDVIVWYVITVAFVGEVASRLFYSDGPKVTVKYLEQATITFYSNFSAYPDHSFKTMFVEEGVSSQTIAAGGLDGFFIQGTKTHFGDRISAKTEKENFILQVAKAQLSDNVKLKATAIYNIGAVQESAIAEVELVVLGGPVKCAGEMKKDLKVTAGQTATLNMTLCGQPVPTVNWTIDDTIVGAHTHKNLGPGKNNFILTLDSINASHCGRDVVLTAVGYSTPHVQEKAKLHVTYKPAVVRTKYNYRSNATCVQTVWHKSDIGLCDDLMYEIVYLDVQGSAVATETVKHPKTEHKYCKGDTTKITDIRIRGKTGTETGQWAVDVIMAKDPTASQSIQKADSEDWKTGAIIGGVIGGVALIVIIIIIVCLCCCTSCLVCCGCKEKEKNIHTGTNTFEYKKNSRKKKGNYIVEDAIAPGTPVYIVDSSTPPTDSSVVYATSTKSTLKKKPDDGEPQFFDPSEFGIKPDKTAEITAQYNNTTYIDDDDDEDYQNKPSMLI